MTDRERLVELVVQYKREEHDDLTYCDIELLCDYLLANGVIVPPCKVGQMVYICASLDLDCEKEKIEIWKGEVESVSLGKDGLWIFCRFECGLTYWYPIKRFVKDVFLTREEAEQALKEREQNDR